MYNFSTEPPNRRYVPRFIRGYYGPIEVSRASHNEYIQTCEDSADSARRSDLLDEWHCSRLMLSRHQYIRTLMKERYSGF